MRSAGRYSSAVGCWVRERLAPRLRRRHGGGRHAEPSGGGSELPVPAGGPAAPPRWLYEMEFAAVLAEIPATRRRVAAEAEALGLSGPALFDLLLAVGEALANAVKHGSPRFQADRVHVRVGLQDGAVVVEVADQGRGFGASRITPPAALEAGGRGIPFMRALVDDLRFELTPHGTRVLLVKRMR